MQMRVRGGTVCSVTTCKNNYRKAKLTGEDLMFVKFPDDTEIRKEWIRRCQKGNEWSCANKRICSAHFKLEDFEDALKATFLNVRPRRLKKDGIQLYSFHLKPITTKSVFLAIPSLFLKPICKNKTKAERIETEAKIIPDNNLMSPNSHEQRQTLVTSEKHPDPSCSTEEDYGTLKKEMVQIKNENLELEQRLIEKAIKVEHLKELITEQNMKIEDIISF